MENMNNTTEMIDAGVADVATGTTFGQKACKFTLAAVTVVLVIKGTKYLIGKVKAKKAAKQNQDVIITVDSEDETK